MTNLKITLTSWAPFIGGAEVAVERLAMGLSAAGHQVLLVVGTDGEALARFRDAGIRCEFVPQQFTDKLKWLQYRRSRHALMEVLRREEPDVVHSNDLPSHQMTSDAARRLGIPRVCHHRWIFEGSAIEWLNKFDADRHLFVSQALMRMLCRESGQLQDSSRAVVYDGLPLPETPCEDDQFVAKRRLGLDPSKLLVLFAGQIIERKGVADLLQAWARLPRHAEQAELVIAGDDLEGEGAYRRQMENLARELNCTAQFVGFQKNIPEWLTAADIVTVPSHAEPLGNATLEAMAHARPVIGGDVGGIPEMVLDGETGLLVPPKSPDQLAQALQQLLAEPELRQLMGQAARRRCEEMFSLDAHVQAVLAEYQIILQHSSTGVAV